MSEFCDVAVPVPLDMVFTYRVPTDAAPVVGGRVLVPFRQQRVAGIVVELHDRKPSVATKNIFSVIDPVPVLDDQLLRLGRWIADYYLAPLGEVFRTMLPLSAEFKRSIAYRLADEGQMALHLAGTSGSSARSRRTPEEQTAEFRVLDYLAVRVHEEEDGVVQTGVSHVSPVLRDVGASTGGPTLVREETLRAVTHVSKSVRRPGWQ
jgi:primosomal protein N' (replication factor Y)